MSSFNISRAADRIYSFKTDVYSNLANSYTTNHGTYSILVDYFWISVRGCNSSHPWFVVADQSCVSNNNCPAGTHETNPGSFCLGCYYTC